jgi:hypothetical protein
MLTKVASQVAGVESDIQADRNGVYMHSGGNANANAGTYYQFGGKLHTTDDKFGRKEALIAYHVNNYNTLPADYYTGGPPIANNGEAVKQYLEYIYGSNILTKSMNADIQLDGVDFQAANGNLIHSVINSDSGNYIDVGGYATQANIKAQLANMTVTGNILHEDYHRAMAITLTNDTIFTGNIIASDVADWNAHFTTAARNKAGDGFPTYQPNGDGVYAQNPILEVTLQNGSDWVGNGVKLSYLKVGEGCTVIGTVTVAGQEHANPGVGEYGVKATWTGSDGEPGGGGGGGGSYTPEAVEVGTLNTDATGSVKVTGMADHVGKNVMLKDGQSLVFGVAGHDGTNFALAPVAADGTATFKLYSPAAGGTTFVPYKDGGAQNLMVVSFEAAGLAIAPFMAATATPGPMTGESMIGAVSMPLTEGTNGVYADVELGTMEMPADPPS